jgi:glycogen synthase
MRMVFLSNLYPPYDLGGFEQWCQEVATALRQRGHEICVLTSQFGVDRQTLAEQNIVRTLHLQTNIHFYRPLDFFLKRRRHDRLNTNALRRVVDQYKPDVLVVWGMWNLSWNLPKQAEELMPGRVAYYIASYWPTDTDMHVAYWNLRTDSRLAAVIKSPLRMIALSQLRREGYPPQLRFDHVMCCSQYVREKLVSAGALPNSSRVLYGGIDPEPFLRDASIQSEAQDHPLRLLYFGSLLPHKGVHTAIEALGILKKRGLGDRVELTIIGTGHPDYQAHLKELVADLELGNIVCFAGRVPRDEIPARLKRFDVFLFTSIWEEPFGRTIVEAMAAGLVVIGSNTGGSREIFQQYDTNLLFQPGDSHELASRIEQILCHPSMRLHLVELGRELVLKQFSFGRIANAFETWLSEISR